MLKMSFTVALSTVGVMLLYALPGFVMIKTKLLQSSAISAFAKLLMYICQPALIIYSFIKVDFSVKTLREMIIVFVFIFAFQTAVLLLFFFLFRKKRNTVCIILPCASETVRLWECRYWRRFCRIIRRRLYFPLFFLCP